MPFDYMHSDIPLEFANAGEKAEAQYLKELRDRAALLYRLRYDKADALKRLRGNLTWDWECNPRPAFVKSIEAKLEGLIEEVYSKPQAPDKGRRVSAKDLKIAPSD